MTSPGITGANQGAYTPPGSFGPFPQQSRTCQQQPIIINNYYGEPKAEKEKSVAYTIGEKLYYVPLAYAHYLMFTGYPGSYLTGIVAGNVLTYLANGSFQLNKVIENHENAAKDFGEASLAGKALTVLTLITSPIAATSLGKYGLKVGLGEINSFFQSATLASACNSEALKTLLGPSRKGVSNHDIT